MPNDRRKPLGGVDKETFVHSTNNPIYNAELTYDLISGLKSDLCHEMTGIRRTTENIQKQCSCRVSECRAEFDKRYITRAFEKIPISKSELIAYLLLAGTLIGMGVLEITDVVKFIK